MSILTRIKQKVTQLVTDDDSHDKHYAKDSQHSDKTSTSDHHQQDDHDHEHSHDKKNKKGKEDIFDFFDQAHLTPAFLF